MRITEDLRAQLDVVAQITGRSTTEEIRVALEHWVAKIKSDPATLQKAAAIRAEIEREAETRRNAIAAIFDGNDSADKSKASTSTPPASRRGSKPANG